MAYWDTLPSTLRRTGSVHRVELKVQLDPEYQTAAEVAQALGLAAGTGTAGEVYYLDNADRTLRRSGLVARARLGGEGGADLVFKMRSPLPFPLPKAVRRLSRLAVELDALPHRTIWCASVKHLPRRSVLADTVRRGGSWPAVCSAEQQLFLRCLTGEPRAVKDLRTSGPIPVLKRTGRVPGLPRLTLESWQYPDGRQVLELSTKCRPEYSNRSAKALRRLLAAHGLAPASIQRLKTETAMRYVDSGLRR
ncbi:MAG: hypothetical protein QOG57_4234 [Pseudonocardiales bacterium]|nr:hypothetical protein [Pseudonocardiales bacterium]